MMKRSRRGSGFGRAFGLAILASGALACQGEKGAVSSWPGLPSPVLLDVIGCVECEGPRSFGGITNVTARGDRLAVTTFDEPFVRLFDIRASAEPVAFGRGGEGPGELTSPQVSVPIDGDSVLVLDSEGRLHLFDGQGTWHATTRLGSNLRSGVSSPSGRYMVGLVGNVYSAVRRDVALVDLERRRIVETRPVPAELHEGSRKRLSYHGLGHAVSNGSEVILGYGDDVYRIQRAFPDSTVSEVTAHDAERFRRPDSDLSSQVPPPPGGWPAGYTPPQPDPFYPYFRLDAMRIDGEGRVWIRRMGARAATVFDIFDPELRFLGQVRLNRGVGLYTLTDRYLVGVIRDQMDVPHVAIWEIR